nr:GNAT family N-acetyltransferase [uncultured Arsenicibacter sp.]
MEAYIRFVTPSDYASVLAIYEPYITGTAITFEYDVPSLAAFSERIRAISDRYPFLVCELDGEIAGYAYATKFRDRAAYGWSVETTVYIHPNAHRRGVASGLYTTLLALLHHQGAVNVYAAITLPNDASVALHKAFGFEEVGVFNGVGYKFDSWHSTQFLAKVLQPHAVPPPAPVLIEELLDTPFWFDAVRAGIARLR